PLWLGSWRTLCLRTGSIRRSRSSSRGVSQRIGLCPTPSAFDAAGRNPRTWFANPANQVRGGGRTWCADPANQVRGWAANQVRLLMFLQLLANGLVTGSVIAIAAVG